MSVSFELGNVQRRQWQLNDCNVMLLKSQSNKWLVWASKPYAFKLRQAGFPINTEIDASMRSIVETVASVLECSPHYHLCAGYYPIGNTIFGVYRRKTQWYLRNLSDGYHPVSLHIGQKRYAAGTFTTRCEAVEQVKEWYTSFGKDMMDQMANASTLSITD